MIQEYTLEEYLQAHQENQLPADQFVGNHDKLILYSGPPKAPILGIQEFIQHNDVIITPYSRVLHTRPAKFKQVQDELGWFNTSVDENYFNDIHYTDTINASKVFHAGPPNQTRYAQTGYQEQSLSVVKHALSKNKHTFLDTRAVPQGSLRALLDAKDMRLTRR